MWRVSFYQDASHNSNVNNLVPTVWWLISSFINQMKDEMGQGCLYEHVSGHCRSQQFINDCVMFMHARFYFLKHMFQWCSLVHSIRGKIFDEIKSKQNDFKRSLKQQLFYWGELIRWEGRVLSQMRGKEFLPFNLNLSAFRITGIEIFWKYLKH